jgi:hypothetical protein
LALDKSKNKQDREIPISIPFPCPNCKRILTRPDCVATGLTRCSHPESRKAYSINWVDDKTKEIGAYPFDESRRNPDWYELLAMYSQKMHKIDDYENRWGPLYRHMLEEHHRLVNERLNPQQSQLEQGYDDLTQEQEIEK